jgi:hypothetical protein
MFNQTYYLLENDVRISLNLRITLVSSASWLACPKVLVLMNKGEYLLNLFADSVINLFP